MVQTDAAGMLDRVIYPPRPWVVARLLVRHLIHRDWTPFADLGLIIRQLWRSPEVLVKSLITWARSVAMIELVREIGPAHIHSHWATYASTAALVLSRSSGVPFSFTAHAHDIFVNDHLLGAKMEKAAFVATISEFNRTLLQRTHPECRHARIEIVRCGVPAMPPTRRDRDSTPPRIVSVGRLDEIKGFPVLLEALAFLRDNGVSFSCRIIGDGPQRSMLRRRIGMLALDTLVEMPGALPSGEIHQCLASADMFVLASQQARDGNMDGIPVALMEAMALQLPVVTTRISGIPELVEDGISGVLVPPGNAHALGMAIATLMADASMRRRLGAAARLTVETRFNSAREAGRLHSLIMETLGARTCTAGYC
ncbi:MAG: glycosyltransferase [Gammaproteobacteria bacterium]|jgi:glycosyltransferase involved in cell wall biosynthesis